MKATKTKDEWTPLWQGVDFELAVMEGKLHACDIPAVIAPKSQIWIYATGGPRTAELQVPTAHVEEAREVLGLPTGGSEPLDAESARRVRLFDQGNRVVFAAALGVAIPIVPGLVGLWLGARYLGDARGIDPKPIWFRVHVAAIPLCALTLPWGWALLRVLGAVD